MASPGSRATIVDVGQPALFRGCLPDPAKAYTGNAIAEDIMDVVQQAQAADFFHRLHTTDNPT